VPRPRTDRGRYVPLAAKSVAKRWGLPEDDGFTAIPNAVFDVVVDTDLNPNSVIVLFAILRVWTWRDGAGLRQRISVSGLSVVTKKDRTAVRRALRDLGRSGLIFVEFGSAADRATFVDITPLRVKAHQRTTVSVNSLGHRDPVVGSTSGNSLGHPAPVPPPDGGLGHGDSGGWVTVTQGAGSSCTSPLGHGDPCPESKRVKRREDAAGDEQVPSPKPYHEQVIERQRANAVARKAAGART
jgi:hypothetical protein